eukprot:2778982-Amphidinium_carterae.2
MSLRTADTVTLKCFSGVAPLGLPPRGLCKTEDLHHLPPYRTQKEPQATKPRHTCGQQGYQNHIPNAKGNTDTGDFLSLGTAYHTQLMSIPHALA